MTMDYTKPKKIQEYAFYMEYSDWDYAYAIEHMKKRFVPLAGACSVVRNGNFVGRNYDYYYDELAGFAVLCRRGHGRHQSIGNCTSWAPLTNAFAETGADDDAYRTLPFAMLDGVNDAGVFVR